MRKSKIILLVIPFLLSSCGRNLPTSVSFSNFNVSGNYHTDTQKQFIEGDSKKRNDMITDLLLGYENLSSPNPINISWNENNDTNDKADKYNVYLSEDNSFDNPIIYSFSEQNAGIYNLKINTKYYYKVESIHGNSSFFSDVSSFTVNDSAPRNLFIEGVENVRDLGGFNIGEGRTFKQGMIYRTAQFNYGGSKNKFVSEPTDLGKRELLDVLKIKTDIDLRRTTASFDYDEVNGITSSPLGTNVKYISTPMEFGGSNIFTNKKNTNAIKDFFNALADVNNYPIAFHCMRGTDRTGALAYALGALLGMSESDLMLDYLFSDFANLGSQVKESSITGTSYYVYGIAHSDGDTISEKAMNYLYNTCGIEKATLNQIIDILTD